MDLRHYVREAGLEPADVIRVRVPRVGILSHFVVFMGEGREGIPWFMACLLPKGVVRLDNFDIGFLSFWVRPCEVIRFQGPEHERHRALKRALEMEGKPYHLFRFNCESFANYVQKGHAHSAQVETFMRLVKFKWARKEQGRGLTAA